MKKGLYQKVVDPLKLDWCLMQQVSPRKNRAFSLVELLIVIVIIGMLSAIALPTFSSNIDNNQLDAETTELQALAYSEANRAVFEKEIFTLEQIEASVQRVAGSKDWVYREGVSRDYGQVTAKVDEVENTATLLMLNSKGDRCIQASIINYEVTMSTTPAQESACLAS